MPPATRGGYCRTVELSDGPAARMRPPLRHRLTQRQWLRIDVAAAVAAFVAAVFKVDLPRASATAFAAPHAVSVLLVALGTLPFMVRRRWPASVLLVLAVAAAVLSGLGRSPLAVDVALGIAAYTVPMRRPRRAAVSALVAAEAVLCAGAAVAISRDVAGAYVTAASLVTAAGWFVGESERYRRRYDQAVAAEADRRRQAERDRSTQAVREERVRIAREIHDVVAHSLTVMTVQAGVARRVVQRPDEANAVLASIEATGRVAQGELRLILGLLRDDEQEEPGLAPAPSLDGLPLLIDEAKAAGVDAELRVSGRKPVISPALELSLYRVIQEALTNTVKHAAGARTAIDLSYGAADIRIGIANAAPPGAAPTMGTPQSAPGTGHGIVGMRERVSAFGGTLAAGPADDGGFLVRVRVPLRDDA
jgi:signal transduction histidine kinase